MTPPTQVTGVITNASGNAARDSGTFATETTQVRDVTDDIRILENPETPFIAVMTAVGSVFDGKTWKQASPLMKEVTVSQTFEELEDSQNGRYCKVSGTYSASGAVTITVTGAGSSSAYIFTPGDVFYNYRTGEKLLLATVASATTVTVASGGRAFGTSAAAAGADGDSLFIIGNANEENGLARNVNSTLKSISSNFT